MPAACSSRFIDHQELVQEQTAIVVAARRGHLPTVQALIRQQARVDVPDKVGMTALMWACRRGNDAIIPLLIAVGDGRQLQVQMAI